jgi:hypothetical protein
MTSLRQIKSNRRNAQKSTGPKTDSGKQRTSQNALRHGLTAETIVSPLEDPEDYRAFEQAVTACYDAETVVERELVLRLASLLWRLRRATSIETGLFQIQNILPESGQQTRSAQDCEIITIFQAGELSTGVAPKLACGGVGNDRDPDGSKVSSEATRSTQETDGLDIARCFLHLADLDNGAFERLGRYESALWRQVRQTISTLEWLRWRPSSARSWRTQDRWHRSLGLPSIGAKNEDC